MLRGPVALAPRPVGAPGRSGGVSPRATFEYGLVPMALIAATR